MTLNNLVVKPASDVQIREVVTRNAAHWGAKAGISEEVFINLNAMYQAEYAQDGRLGVWVLVPKNDTETTNFYTSCQVFTRDILVLYPNQTIPVSELGHAIFSVLTPPQHRSKGYGKRFMSLLHAVLAPHRYPDPQNSVTPEHSSSMVSVLYSAVGDFYASCPPASGESGWRIQKSMKTVWTLASVKGDKAASPPAVHLLSDSDVATALSSDDENIHLDLLRRQVSDPAKTYFIFSPTAPVNAHSLILSKLTSGCSANASWGARMPDRDDFITWVYEARASRKLIITRLRASVESFPILFNAAVNAAREAKSELIEAWNVPQDLAEIVHATGGETTERQEQLSAFKWYGKGLGLEEDVVWALDERYGWC